MSERVLISKRLVLINSASSVATRLISMTVLIWLQQYLLKRISPEEYQLLPILYSVMMFAPLVTTILTGGLGRYIVEAYARNDDQRVTQIVSTMLPILCAAGLAFLACGWTLAWHVDWLLKIPPERVWDARIMMAALMFSAAVRLPLAPLGVGLYVRQKFVLQNAIAVGTELFRLTVLFVLLFAVSTRVLWVIVASVTAEMLNLLIVQFLSMHYVSSLRYGRASFRWSIAGEITGFGGWNFLMSLGETLRTSANPIILNRFASAYDVACFNLGSLVQNQLHWAVGNLLGPLNPALTALHAAGDTERLKRSYLRVGRVAMLGGLLIVLPFILFCRPLIELYVGIRYITASTVLAFLLAQSITYWGNILLAPIALAKGRVRWLSIFTSTANVTNIVLTLFLVLSLELGAPGSALATFICSTCLNLVFLGMAIRLVGVSAKCMWREVWLPGMLPSIAAVPVWVILGYAFYPDTWVLLFIECAAGAVIYLIVGMMFSLKREDWDDARRIAAFIWSIKASVAQ